MASMRLPNVVLLAAVFVLTSFSASNLAQAELNCDDSWTAAYKCLEGCGPCPDDSGGGNDNERGGAENVAPPQVDPRADARSRITALIATYADVIDQGRWTNVASMDDGRFDSALIGLHHELWTEMAEAQVAVADRRPQIASYSESYKDFQDREAKLDADSVLRQLDDAKTELLNKKAQLEAHIAQSEASSVLDDGAATYAREEWLKARNDTLQQLRGVMPKTGDLPDAANNVSFMWQPQQPYATDVPVDPPPTPPGRLLPRQYSLFADIDLTHINSPPPEPTPSADVTGRVTELEQIAGWTRNARQELKAVQDANAAFGARYNSLAQAVAGKERDVEAVRRDVTFLDAEVARLGQLLQKANAEERAAAWSKTLAGVRAAAWDIMRDKVIMPEIEKLPHYADYDRAKKGLDLVKQVLQLEKDAEFYSSAAAETLALGPTAHTAEITANVWGATREQAETSIDRTMDLIEAPADLKKAWKALLTSEP